MGRGELEQITSKTPDELAKKIDQKVDELNESGWNDIDEDECDILIIEYKIDGWGAKDDLEKRHAVQDRMNELLGWTGVGWCDGGQYRKWHYGDMLYCL